MKFYLTLLSVIFVNYLMSQNSAVSQLKDELIIKKIESFQPLKGAKIPLDIRNRLGATHVAGKYYFTKEPYLIEGAKKMIDLGYGDGVVSPALAKFTELTVVEGSEDLCDIARKFLPPSVNVVNEFFEDYSPNTLADFVVASHVLEHVDEPIQLLRRIRSWIKPDGALIAIVPNKESIHRRIARDMGMITKLDELSNRDLLVGHQRVYGLNELIDHFTEAGFIVEEFRGFFLKPLSNGQMLDWSIPALKSLNEIAATSPPQLCANLAIIGKL